MSAGIDYYCSKLRVQERLCEALVQLDPHDAVSHVSESLPWNERNSQALFFVSSDDFFYLMHNNKYSRI